MNNSKASLPVVDKPQLPSVKKVALRDLPNESTNIINKPAENSTFNKKRGFDMDSTKVSGIKRQKPDCLLTTPHHKSAFNGVRNEHLVYARRKLESGTAKPSACGYAPTDNSAKSKGFSIDGKLQSNGLQVQMQVPRFSSSLAFQPVSGPLNISSRGPLPSYSSAKPITGFPVVEPSYSVITTGSPVTVSSQEVSNLHWKERFLRLQAFLKSRDQSSQEEYIQMLRSLSAAGRSQHAVELEKRAIHLLLEEGKELHRMKVLNVLGKASPSECLGKSFTDKSDTNLISKPFLSTDKTNGQGVGG